ncbi:Serine/threonine-protein kinase PRR1 [Wickerhamiella sorbophila]|uniref:Serine/threonine-protein kinase PRR1 n=1 Tax=Wickerhamiella sorbophila TaxID=45607 RepID=A0A2T0FPX8_9ASCO|nr:Serine/threonine-protein kinase PRR1 [Wickerhamiella sorbophila]PRT57035.1 Serine/threonine-protein kinase PRR1 [Wickerhamiella sorbophila]
MASRSAPPPDDISKPHLKLQTAAEAIYGSAQRNVSAGSASSDLDDFNELSQLPSPRPDDGQSVFAVFSGAEAPMDAIVRQPSMSRRVVHGGMDPNSPLMSPTTRFGSNVIARPQVLDAPISLPKRTSPRPHSTLQRVNSVRLHREVRVESRTETPRGSPGPELPVVHEDFVLPDMGDRFKDKADVYIAFTPSLKKTTWDRVRFLGKGSFSQVILATPTLSQVHPELIYRARATFVAVKITSLGKAHTPERLQLEEALRRDVELVKSLSHPNLMSIIAFNIDEARALVVLPYCAGGDLFELVSVHRVDLSANLVRRMFADVVSAVAYLHQNYVVHRDIKLENVLVTLPAAELLALEDPISYPHPICIVTDLGLARTIDPDNPLLTTRCGSEDYVPPEILMGQPYDGRVTDCWALGALLYAVLEGRLPFDPPPNAPPLEGRRARLRTAQRIARIDWAWYKRKDEPPDSPWAGGQAVVDGCFQPAADRLRAPQILEANWIKGALNESATPPVSTDPISLFVDQPVPAEDLREIQRVTSNA